MWLAVLHQIILNAVSYISKLVATVPPDLNLTLARVQCTTDPQLSSNTREQS